MDGSVNTRKTLFLFIAIVVTAAFPSCRRRLEVEKSINKPITNAVSIIKSEAETVSIPESLTTNTETHKEETPGTVPEYRKPIIPEGVRAEKILTSKPIPGVPVMIIYRFRETESIASDKLPENNSTSKTDGKITIEPQPVIKPEPAAIIVEEKKQEQEDIPGPSAPVPIAIEQTDEKKTEPEGIDTVVITETTEKIPEHEEASASGLKTEPELKAVVSAEPETEPQPKTEPARETAAEEPLIRKEKTTNQIEKSRQGILPPGIRIITPADKSFYTGKIRIEGQISNSDQDPYSVDKIETVTWEISGKTDPEEIVFGSDGIFFLSIPTDNFKRTVNINITAKNKSGKINIKRITLYDGNTKPEITLQSPANNSQYGAFLKISGTVKDTSASDLNLEGPERIEYSLFPVGTDASGTEISGTIPVTGGTDFKSIIDTGKIKGKQLLTLTVYARNGKTAKTSLTIDRGNSDIPGFKAEPGESSATLLWDDLPGAKSYTLYYSTGKNIPGISKNLAFQNVTSPLTLRNLNEGVRYRFRLKAVTDNTGRNEYWSGIKDVIALTPSTLKPLATDEYEQIRLVWLDIPGTDKFDILRSESLDGGYRVIVPEFTGTSYTDKTAVFGKKYFYKIRPSLENSLISDCTSAETLKFPEEKTVVIGTEKDPQLQRITVQGSYLFLASGVSGIKIIDNTDTGNPVETGRLDTNNAKDIVVRGERAYVADGERGLKVVDISDPGNPEIIGSRKTAGAVSLAIKGNIIYVADGTSGIKIMDISSERKPVRLGTVRTSDAKEIVLQDNFLYLADGSGGAKIFHSESSSLKLIGEFQCSDAAGISVHENLMAVNEPGLGVRLIDISKKDDPIEVRTILSSNITDSSFKDNYLFFTSSSDGLSIYEISDPQRPVLFDSVKEPGAKSLTADSGTIYIIDENGYKVVKSFTTGRSFTIAEFKTGGKAYSVTVKDNILFLADHKNGVKIIETSNPSDSSKFSISDSIDTSFAESVFFKENKLFIADGNGGIVMTDVVLGDKGPEIGTPVSVKLPGVAKSVTVQGKYAYISARENGINILDMETKNVTNVYTGGSVYKIHTSRGMLYAADGSGGVKIYSLENPGEPILISQVDIPDVTSISSRDNTIAAGGKGGLTLIDASDPHNPVVVSRYPLGWIEDIYIQGHYLYAAAGSQGLQILDIKEPETPVLVSSCEDIYAVGVDVKDDLAFVADIEGFKVVKILIPSWLR